MMGADVTPEDKTATPATPEAPVPRRAAVAEGTARFVTTGALRAAEILTRQRSLAPHLPPSLPRTPAPGPWLALFAQVGHGVRVTATAEMDRMARAAARGIVLAVLDELDLTALVRERVDLDAVAEAIDVDAIVARVDMDAIVDRVDMERILARVDVDAIAARLDVDAFVARLDLVGLAEVVVDGIDLPGIIRESSGAVASDTVRSVRMQSLEADEAVARAASRWLPHRHAADDAAALPAPRERPPELGPDDGAP